MNCNFLFRGINCRACRSLGWLCSAGLQFFLFIYSLFYYCYAVLRTFGKKFSPSLSSDHWARQALCIYVSYLFIYLKYCAFVFVFFLWFLCCSFLSVMCIRFYCKLKSLSSIYCKSHKCFPSLSSLVCCIILWSLDILRALFMNCLLNVPIC